MTTTPPIRLLIADDHAIVREGLVAMLALKHGIEIVAEAADGHEAAQLAAQAMPDIILMDVKMPGLDGVEATRRILAENPKARILMLSSFTDDALIVESVQAGAMGYILKEDSIESLVTALREVHAGATPTSTIVAQTLMRQLRRDKAEAKEPPPRHEALTDRELEIVCLLAAGCTNAKIADRLSISERTVSTHISRSIRKLELDNRTQLALYALRHGLAPLHPDDGQDQGSI